jgi:hypothetical protein
MIVLLLLFICLLNIGWQKILSKKENKMKKNASILTAVISILVLLFAAESFAQRGMGWKGSGGWGQGAAYGKMYDPKTVETISGEVISVDKITPAKGMSYGVHLTVKTDKETISVHMGPGWFIENQDIKIEPKDDVEVTGSRITFEGKPAMIAAEVKKSDELLKLRDENGFPVWSGWRRR